MSILKDLKDQENTAKLLADKFEGSIKIGSDADGDFKSRNTSRIDIAQLKAEESLERKKIIYKNIGFDSKDDRIPSQVWFKVPQFIRCLPDMFILSKDKFNFLEIKGCRDSVKFKIDDLHQYNLWNGIAPVYMFIYSASLDKKYVMSLNLIWDSLALGEWGRYKDNNKLYISIKCEYLEDYSRK